MIGITDIATYLPAAAVSNLERLDDFGVSEEFLRGKLGMLNLCRKQAQEEASDLAVIAVKRLLDQTGLDPKKVEALIVVTQNPDGYGLPHTSAIVHGKMHLASNCACFDVSLGCSGFVHSLSILKGFIESNDLANGILVTSDPYSKVLRDDDRDTTLLFGDAATATLLSDDPQWTIGKFDFGTAGNLSSALQIDDQHKLRMNGRAVFNFSATAVPQSISRALHLNNCEIEELDKIILHQGSRYLVDTIAKRTGSEDKTPFFAEDSGNTVSSSIPIILAHNLMDSDLRVLISGFGVGLAWATTVIERVS